MKLKKRFLHVPPPFKKSTIQLHVTSKKHIVSKEKLVSKEKIEMYITQALQKYDCDVHPSR